MKKSLIFALAVFLFTISASAQKHQSYNFTRAMEYLEKEDIQNTMLYLNKHIKDYPDDNEAFYYRSLIYKSEENYSLALRDINSAIRLSTKKDKNMYAFYRFRAKIYRNMELYDEAELDFKTAINLNKENTNLVLDIINFYKDKDNYDEIEVYAKKILKLDIASPMGYIALGDVCSHREDYKTAIENYDKAIKYASHHSDPYSRKAHILYLQKKYKEALDVAITALDLDGVDSYLYYLIENLVEKAPNDVIKKMNQLIREQKDNYFWYQIRAEAFENIKEYEKALADYLKAEEIMEYHDAGQYQRASYVCMEMGDYYSALEYINNAIKIAIDKDIIEDNSYMYLSKADINVKLSNYQDAIEASNEVIKIDPSYAYAYTHRGMIHRVNNFMERALEDFNEAIEIDDEGVTAYLYRGRVLDALGKSQQAKKDYEMVVELDTAIHKANYKIFALFHLGKEQEAIALLNKMLEKNPESGAYNAACLYSLMNEKANAIKYLDIALSTGEQQDFYHIDWDDDLNNIRESPEYKALMKQYDNRHKYNKEAIIDSEMVEKTTIVKMKKSGGIFEVPCEINGLKLRMFFDSGASDVTISSTESNFMFKNGYLKPKDVLGTQSYLDASGNINEGTVINLSEVKLGDFTLKNVKASVVHNQNAPLLLGQTVLKRFATISIDNEKLELQIIYKEKK